MTSPCDKTVDISPFDVPIRVSIDCYSTTCNYVITFFKSSPIDGKGVFTVIVENTGINCSTAKVTASYTVENGVYKFVDGIGECCTVNVPPRGINIGFSSGGGLFCGVNESFTVAENRFVPPTRTGISITSSMQLYLKLGLYDKEVQEVILKLKGENEGLSLCKYCGTICPGLIQVLFLRVNDVIKGEGTLLEKTNKLGIGAFVITEYILVKVLMGLLINGRVSLKWALRCNYKTLVSEMRKSDYDDVLPWLLERKCMEKYLR